MSESPAQEALLLAKFEGVLDCHPPSGLKGLAEAMLRELTDLAQQLEQDGLTIRDLQASEKRYHDLWKKAEQQLEWFQKHNEISAKELEQAEQKRNVIAAENTELRIDRQVAEQRIKELERALEIAMSCVGNYAADSNLGEALAAVGINRHPEEDGDETRS
jgi:glycine cleavage system pyridoxal-binding protein P